MVQLSRIPKEMRDNWSARIYHIDNSIYHLEPDTDTRYWNPWKLVKDMAKDPEKMGSVLGMMEEGGPPSSWETKMDLVWKRWTIHCPSKT